MSGRGLLGALVLAAAAAGGNAVLYDARDQSRLAPGHEIRALADVDGDGISELVVTGSGFGQGILERVARLYGAKGGRVELLHETYGAYRNTCGGDGDRGGSPGVALRAGSGPPADHERDLRGGLSPERRSPARGFQARQALSPGNAL